MASNQELEARLLIVENMILNAIEIPDFMVNISSSVDKTGKWCYGSGVVGINGGGIFVGWRSTVANPTTNADFDLKGYTK